MRPSGLRGAGAVGPWGAGVGGLGGRRDGRRSWLSVRGRCPRGSGLPSVRWEPPVDGPAPRWPRRRRFTGAADWRALAVGLHLVHLGLEDAHGAAEAAGGVREPLPAEDDDEEHRDDDDLGCADSAHGVSAPSWRRVAVSVRGPTVGAARCVSARRSAACTARRARRSARTSRGSRTAAGGPSASSSTDLHVLRGRRVPRARPPRPLAAPPPRPGRRYSPRPGAPESPATPHCRPGAAPRRRPTTTRQRPGTLLHAGGGGRPRGPRWLRAATSATTCGGTSTEPRPPRRHTRRRSQACRRCAPGRRAAPPSAAGTSSTDSTG